MPKKIYLGVGKIISVLGLHVVEAGRLVEVGGLGVQGSGMLLQTCKFWSDMSNPNLQAISGNCQLGRNFLFLRMISHIALLQFHNDTTQKNYLLLMNKIKVCSRFMFLI